MKKATCFLFFLGLILSLQGRILMKPYLQSVTTSSVYVMVECDNRDTVHVHYGLNSLLNEVASTGTIAATTASPATFVHKVKLAGLSPEQCYSYEVVQGGSRFGIYKFHTGAEAGTGFRFAWMADFRTNTDIHDKIALLVSKRDPLFSLYGGDLCANSTYVTWKREFFVKNEQDLISEVPFFNSVGNHEGMNQNTSAFLQNPVSGSHTQDYYSFDYGDVHFLCINTELSVSEGSRQYNFIAADLAGTSKKWKVVFSHIPAYGAGAHGENPAMILVSQKLFEPYHVDLVLSGHSHYYQHNLVNGIHHFIIGSAGAPLYTPIKASYTVKSAMAYNYAIIDVTPGSIVLNVYDEKNKVLDYLELKKQE